MAAKFKAGDIIELKSGGPKMTVEEVTEGRGNNPDGLWAVWFAGAKRERAHFNIESVKLAKEEPSKK